MDIAVWCCRKEYGELWDFNPYRVRHAGSGFTVDDETSRLTVESERSCARSHGNQTRNLFFASFCKACSKKVVLYLCGFVRGQSNRQESQ